MAEKRTQPSYSSAATYAVCNFQTQLLTWLKTVMKFKQTYNQDTQSIWTRHFTDYILKVTNLHKTYGEQLRYTYYKIPSFGETVCYLRESSKHRKMNVLVFKFTQEEAFTFAKFTFDANLQTITNCLDTDVLHEFQLTAEKALHKECKTSQWAGTRRLIKRIFKNNPNLKTKLDGSIKA